MLKTKINKLLWWASGTKKKETDFSEEQYVKHYAIGAINIILSILIVFFSYNYLDQYLLKHNIFPAELNNYHFLITFFINAFIGLIVLIVLQNFCSIPNKLNKIQRIFWWSAGANVDILQEYKTEHAKYFGVGGTILFTALMATFAGGYAFFTAFKDVYLSIFFGIFWGSLIFNLDRYIVSSFGVGDGKKSISWPEIWAALPRVIMAILLGFVIAMPLELKLFEKEITVEIDKIIKEEKKKLIALDENYESANKSNAESKKELDSLMKIDITSIKTIHQESVGNKQNQIANIESKININKGQLRQLKINLNNKKNSYKRKWNNNGIYRDTITIQQRYPSRSSYVNSKTRDEARLVNNKEKEITNFQKQIDQLNNEIATLQNEEFEYKSQLSEQRNNDIKVIKNRKKNNQDIIDKSRKIQEDIAKQYNGFMAQLQAFSNLKSKHPSLSWAALLITLLFIFIEIAPILFKMMIESGPYDQKIKQLNDIESNKLKEELSLINDEINNNLKLSVERHKQNLAEELQANEKLLRSIADAQAEIAIKQVEKWKKEQLDNIKK